VVDNSVAGEAVGGESSGGGGVVAGGEEAGGDVVCDVVCPSGSALVLLLLLLLLGTVVVTAVGSYGNVEARWTRAGKSRAVVPKRGAMIAQATLINTRLPRHSAAHASPESRWRRRSAVRCGGSVPYTMEGGRSYCDMPRTGRCTRRVVFIPRALCAWRARGIKTARRACAHTTECRE